MISKNKKFVIGALHFMPLKDYQGYTDYRTIQEKAKADLKAFENGGVDFVIIENNYNLPHRIKETKEVVEMMCQLAKGLANISNVPLGVSLLWNDFEGAFAIAKVSGARFVRVPVFVDSVKTDFGEIIAEPEKVLAAREKIKAEDILIFADIHVKHAEMLDRKKSIADSAKEAKDKGADAIIITGRWTGDAPILDDLKEARKAVGPDFPIIVGSGADKENVRHLLAIADGVIVSTALKEGGSECKEVERNLKPYSARIDVNKVREFMNIVRNVGKPETNGGSYDRSNNIR